MDGGGRLAQSLSDWLGRRGEAFALWRAGRAAERRAPKGLTIPRGIGSTFAILFLLGCFSFGFVQGGHYDQMRREQGSVSDILARAIGFGVDHIAVTGNQELSREEVIGFAGLTRSASLPFLDPRALQDRLLAVPMIREAQVVKLYPDRLRIEIKERVPYALWQNDGQVQVIAVDGTAIENLSDARFLRLPHVVGKDANLRVKEFVALLDSVPDFSNHIRAATLVSGRRWTLKLQNGVDLRLPELDAEKALKTFVAMEAKTNLSDRGVLAIDLRVPDRVIVRLTEEAAASHAEAVVSRIKKAGGKV